MGSTIVLAMVILVILTSLLQFIIPCYSIFCTIFFIELVSFAAIFGQLENRYFHFGSLIYKYFIYVEYFVGLYIVSNGFFLNFYVNLRLRHVFLNWNSFQKVILLGPKY